MIKYHVGGIFGSTFFLFGMSYNLGVDYNHSPWWFEYHSLILDIETYIIIDSINIIQQTYSSIDQSLDLNLTGYKSNKSILRF